MVQIDKYIYFGVYTAPRVLGIRNLKNQEFKAKQYAEIQYGRHTNMKNLYILITFQKCQPENLFRSLHLGF